MNSPDADPLAGSQRRFAAAVLGGPDAAGPLLAELAGPPEIVLRRLAAYHRNIYGNWIAALATTYPRVAARLGDAQFGELARAFAAGHHSRSGDLGEYGEEFPAWLGRQPIAVDRPWLADLAGLEFDIQSAWPAADCAPFDFSALASIPAERHGELRFRMAPAFRSRRSPWPLAELWHERIAAPAATDHYAWVVRPFDRVGVEAATVAEGLFLDQLAAGRPLAAAIAEAAAGGRALDAGATLVRAARLGILADIIFSGASS